MILQRAESSSASEINFNQQEIERVHVQASVKRRGPGDILVRRKGRLYVINKKKPRNKQRQG